MAPLDCEPLRRELVQGLTAFVVAHPQVRIDAVDEIERAGSGKLRRFVPLAREPR